MEDVFGEFEADFDAERIHLLLNYRSAPELVRIQGIIASYIDEDAPQATSARITSDGESDGECLAFEFPDHRTEADEIAKMIAGWINADSLSARDICVLCRHSPDRYAKDLQRALSELGLDSRVENELQDLLSEPLTSIVLHTLRLASGVPSPKGWSECVDAYCQTQGATDERAERRAMQSLSQFIKRQLRLLADLDAPEQIKTLVEDSASHTGSTALDLWLRNGVGG